MNEDYLWDRTGEADPEIVRLENLLGEYRLKGKQPQAAGWRTKKTVIPLAIAAAVALAALLFPYHQQTSWHVVSGNAAPRTLRAGEMVETGPSARATISDDSVGQVELDPNSRLQISSSRKQPQRFALQLGVIHARIWAPPAEFVVDTPSAEAVDLGCSYTLEVGPDGSGRVVC